MKLKPALIIVTSLATCSFQTQASLCNGGFEDGLRCWGGWTEDFGFKEVISSYTDGSGDTFTPTEGSSMVSLWLNNDLLQPFSWSTGDHLSFDWIAASGTNPSVPNVRLWAALFDGRLSRLEILLNGGSSNTTTFNTFNHTFTQDSPDYGGLLLFQAQGPQPFRGYTDEEVGHILIDNVRLTNASDIDDGTGVPEPDTAFLMGIVLLFGLNNRIARKRPMQKIETKKSGLIYSTPLANLA